MVHPCKRTIFQNSISEPDKDTKWVGSFGSWRYSRRYVATLLISFKLIFFQLRQKGSRARPSDAFLAAAPGREAEETAGQKRCHVSHRHHRHRRLRQRGGGRGDDLLSTD